MQVQQKSYTQKFQQQSYNKLSSLTTYYSSKLINKTIILFVLSPLLFKKNVFPFSFSFFPLFSVVSPYHRFSLSEIFFFLSSSSLFSSPLLWSFSLFFFFFSSFFPSLFLSSIQCFFLFSFFPSLFSPILFPFHQWIMVVVDHGS